MFEVGKKGQIISVISYTSTRKTPSVMIICYPKTLLKLNCDSARVIQVTV